MIPTGKVAPEFLQKLLAAAPTADSVVVGPGLGLDAAVVDSGDELVVAAADPITFPVRRPARYVVTVNANDVVVMGGQPRWFLATVLFPEGVTEAEIAALFSELRLACDELGVALVGGHSEITPAVSRTVIAGTMLGTVPRGGPLSAAGARPGDEMWLAGALAVEGTALLCEEFASRLLGLGVEEEIITRGALLLEEPGISVVPAARAAAGSGAVTAMHDPTEGGLASALHELARAAGCSIEIDLDSIPIREETRIVCAALGLEPLGLLASGSLLLTVNPKEGDNLSAALLGLAIDARRIGTCGTGRGVWVRRPEGREPLPYPERDELARFLETMTESTQAKRDRSAS